MNQLIMMIFLRKIYIQLKNYFVEILKTCGINIQPITVTR